MKPISLYRRFLPFWIRWLIESLIQGQYYRKAVPIKRNKQGEVTYELSFTMRRPYQLGCGVYCNVKDFRLKIQFLYFELAVEPFEDLPF